MRRCWTRCTPSRSGKGSSLQPCQIERESHAGHGLAVYLVNFYLIAPVLFPWFVEARNWVSLVAHTIFGMAVAGAYVALRNSRQD